MVALNLWRCKSCGGGVDVKKHQLCTTCYQRDRKRRLSDDPGFVRLQDVRAKARLERRRIKALAVQEAERKKTEAVAEVVIESRVRAARWFARISEGENAADIAEDEGLSRERVRQVLSAHGYPTRLPKVQGKETLSPRMRKLFRIIAVLDKSIKRGAASECWEWQGPTQSPNPKSPHVAYAKILAFDPLDSEKARSTTVHRVVHMLHKGPIPEGMVVDHICFNTRCCNPAHLQLLTPSENCARKDPRRKSKAPINGPDRPGGSDQPAEQVESNHNEHTSSATTTSGDKAS